MERVIDLKSEQSDLEVEYEVFLNANSALDGSEYSSKIEDLNRRIRDDQNKIDALDKNIERLTNAADGVDYTLSVASGIITGLIDVFFVGECSFIKANEWGNKTADEIVKRTAKAKGYKGDDVAGAIKHLEEAFPIAADKATNFFGGGYYHHLRDFSHHPTPVGLFFSLLTQFTKRVYGTNVAGVFDSYPLTGNELLLVGENLPEKITFGVINWFFHLISDMAGSSKTVSIGGEGTGIPGPIGALLKEVSSLPIFKNTNENGYKEFSVWVTKLFRGTIIGDKNNPVKFDLRTEIGISEQIGMQMIPVLINNCVVRGFYFIKQLVREIINKKPKTFKEFFKLDWKNIAPFNNRTVQRMLVISMGTMTAIDLGDAAIEAAAKGAAAIEGTPAASAAFFAKTMLMRVNFVGVGRFAIACGTDLRMGLQKEDQRNKRIDLCMEQLKLSNVIILYRQAEIWETAQGTGREIQDAFAVAESAYREVQSIFEEEKDEMEKLSKMKDSIDANNPGLTKEIKNKLRWG